MNDEAETSFDKSRDASQPRVSVLGVPPPVPPAEPIVSAATEQPLNERLDSYRRGAA